MGPGARRLYSNSDENNDLASSYIDVLRSKSEHPFVVEHRQVLHRIGVTGGDVKSRIAGAEIDLAYLLADFEGTAKFKLANIHRTRLAALLHKMFGCAGSDLELKDRFDVAVKSQESD